MQPKEAEAEAKNSGRCTQNQMEQSIQHRRQIRDSRQTKSYPKRKQLPEFDEEALEPPQSKNKEAARSDGRPHSKQRAASGAAHKPARDPYKDPRKEDGPVKSIYGSRKQVLESKTTR